MNRAYYSDSIAAFVQASPDEILGVLAKHHEFALDVTQREAWRTEIRILQRILRSRAGSIYFEYAIPRMGRRIDVLLLIGPVIFVLEFKVGEREFTAYAMDQVWDYALDLKNFHETSHAVYIAPILIATRAPTADPVIALTPQNDQLFHPIPSTVEWLPSVLDDVLRFADV
jgi:hypothetical protein